MSGVFSFGAAYDYLEGVVGASAQESVKQMPPRQLPGYVQDFALKWLRKTWELPVFSAFRNLLKLRFTAAICHTLWSGLKKAAMW